MFEIDGDDWLDKYATSTGGYESARNEGNRGVLWLGLAGILNSTFSVWTWFNFLKVLSNSQYWITWWSVCVIHGALWFPIAILWPAMGYGGLRRVRVMAFLARMTYIGVFGAYWANAFAMIYVMFVDPEGAQSDLTSS